MAKRCVARVLSVSLMAMGLLAGGAHADSDDGPHWSYEGKDGPEHWGNLGDDYIECRLGKNQSPVDLDGVLTRAPDRLGTEYPLMRFEVKNTGETVKVTPKSSPGAIVFDGKRFELKQFHFHTPSEHTFKTKHFPVEVHFVHQSEEGELAVLGVMLREGAENPALKPILEAAPEAGKEVALASELDVRPLMPRQHAYFRLNGSLTTPPCSEGVNWVVFAKPVEASAEQIKTLHEQIGTNNNRPVQPINAWPVIEVN